MESRNLAAIVLAAGMSRRMGQPKMLLPWGKSTVLGRVVAVIGETVTESAADEAEKRLPKEGEAGKRRKADFEIVVVTGGAKESVEAEVARLEESFPVRAVFNAQYEAGEMMSSIRTGLAGLGPEVDAALIVLGDQPQLSSESAWKVVSAWKMSGSRLIIPSFNMRRGHPWLVGRELWTELCEENTARDFLKAHAREIFYVECDETVLKDLDTPEDYARDSKIDE